MKVLITGAGGFVGSHLARLAVTRSDVVGLLSPHGDPARMTDIASRMRVVRGNLTDDAVIERLAELKPDVCIHCAWCGGDDYLDSMRNVEAMSATLRLALRLSKGGCRRFVGVGTCLEYDTSQARPLTEASAVAPKRLYAACKVGTWRALRSIGLSTGASMAWARLFYIYGPWEERRRLVASVINGLLQGREVPTSPGEQVRDFLHVADVASALWSLATSATEGPVNVGSGSPVTVAELAAQLGQIAGRSGLVKRGALPYRKGDPMFVCADNTRLVDECGWKPSFSLRTGLEDTVDWWRGRRLAPEGGVAP